MNGMSIPAANLSTQERRALVAELLHQKAKQTRAFPLSYAQQRLWLLEQLMSAGPVYNMPRAVSLIGPLAATALEQSLSEIVMRHHVLRARFIERDGVPFQLIDPTEHLRLKVVDLSGLDEQESAVQAKRSIRQESNRPFDLARGALLRTKLLRLDENHHALAVNMHHIITDVWSMGIFVRELSMLFEAYCAGIPSPLAELSIQYSDFARWQRQRLDGEAVKRQVDYWKQQLANAPAVIELPTDHRTPPTQSFRGARQSLRFGSSLTKSLKNLSRHEKVTPFMTLLAAFQTLLCQYTCRDDIVVGTPIANRSSAQTEGLIGCFVNLLVLRTDLSNNPRFRDLLGRVREGTLGAYANQDVPFEKLVEELQLERSLSHMPLFQVVFDVQNTPQEELQLARLMLSPIEVETETAKYDLALHILEAESELVGVLDYNTDLFEQATIKRMLGHFVNLLEGIAANPDERLAALALLSEPERFQLLVEWNDTEAQALPVQRISSLFDTQVQQRPDAVALSFEGQQLTYLQLNRRSNQLAHYLQTLGVGPEVRVAICMQRSPDMVVGLLAIIKAGGAYVPLDPTYPIERLSFLLEDAQTPVLLTEQRVLDELPSLWMAVACLDLDWPRIAQHPDHTPACETKPHNLAYVIYTSGSTGRPKGVQITHAGLLNLVGWHWRRYGVKSTDRATLLAAVGFDASVWELWPYVLAGASVYIPDEQTRAHPEQLRDCLIREAVTISFLPTPLAETVIELEWPEEVVLRQMLTGGDKLNSYPRERLPFTMINNYGPTENTVVATAGPVTSQNRAGDAPSIGRAIDNTQLYILDRHMRNVPIGVAGELYIGGDSLARGYLNRAELTAERFIPNPFDERKGRLYKTGDLVRNRRDGAIEFLGRVDYQVKIRGHRLELGEIESVIRQCRQVKDAVVVVREETPGDKRLVAYLASVSGETLSLSQLRQELEEKLPGYMVPARFVFLDEMPVSANGKVDRAALPVPESGRPEAGSDYVAPQTEIERRIAAVWQQVLQIEKAGIHDNFFDLGGHSLLLIQVNRHLRETLKQDLAVVEMFKYPTISTLARYLSQKQGEQPSLQHRDARAETRKESINRRRHLKRD